MLNHEPKTLDEIRKRSKIISYSAIHIIYAATSLQRQLSGMDAECASIKQSCIHITGIFSALLSFLHERKKKDGELSKFLDFIENKVKDLPEAAFPARLNKSFFVRYCKEIEGLANEEKADEKTAAWLVVRLARTADVKLLHTRIASLKASVPEGLLHLADEMLYYLRKIISNTKKIVRLG